jgi:hypothetical protein
MGGRTYLTVADELIELADAIADYQESMGYKVWVERTETPYPSTPTLVAKRNRTTLITEVDSEVRLTKLEVWSRYGRSCQRDTRIAVAIPESAQLSAKDEAQLNDLGVGAYQSLPDRVLVRVTPKDLAVNAALPHPQSLPQKIRALVGPFMEQFERGDWREAFDAACRVVEVEARKYLIVGVNRGRVVIVGKKGVPLHPTPQQIEKWTLGQLAVGFQNIQKQNKADSEIGKVLSIVNKDRVRVTHFGHKADTEVKLRKNVGQHMWSLIRALREIHGV